MTYVAQTTIRQEVRSGTAGPVLMQLDNEVASATFRVLTPEGDVALGATSATVTQYGTPPRSRLSCSVPTSLALGEGYQLEVTHGSTVELTFFDVVLRPLGRVPSLDDVLQIRTQAASAIEAAAHRLGVSPEDYVTQTLGDRARGWLEGMLRSTLYPPDDPKSDYHWAYPAMRTYDGRVIQRRPYAILDTDRIHRVEVLLSVAALYESMKGGGEDDSARTLYNDYMQEAQSMLRSIGPIRLDIDGDGSTDAEQQPSGASLHMQRVQG